MADDTQHSPEDTWSLSRSGSEDWPTHYIRARVPEHNQHAIAKIEPIQVEGGVEVQAANANRMVDCVRVCAGVSDERIASLLDKGLTMADVMDREAAVTQTLEAREVLRLRERCEKQEDLLARAAGRFGDTESAPDSNWWREYLRLSGDHYVLTADRFWESGEAKQDLIEQYGEAYIEDEVNAPED